MRLVHKNIEYFFTKTLNSDIINHKHKEIAYLRHCFYAKNLVTNQIIKQRFEEGHFLHVS